MAFRQGSTRPAHELHGATGRYRRIAQSLWLGRGRLVLGLLGLLLVGAALSKALHLATNPVLETGLFASRWFQIGWVEFELLFGGWLLTGWFPRATRIAGIALFTTLAAVAVAKALAGDSSCGCFGVVQVSPWYVFLLDLAAVTSLWIASPRTASDAANSTLNNLDGAEVKSNVLGLTLRIGLFSILMTGLTVVAIFSANSSVRGSILSSDEWMILEGDALLGKPFPFFEEIDIGNQLTQGEWNIIFFRQDCDVCHDVIPVVIREKRWGTFSVDPDRLVLVAVPPHDDHHNIVLSSLVHTQLGTLSHHTRWFVETPLMITMRDGTVTDFKSPTTRARIK